MYYIKTPATSANLGPGFDCIGLSLSLYNHLWIKEKESGLEIIHQIKNKYPVPTDERNLIYKTIRNFYKEIDQPLPGLKLIQKDYIPMTRGLGSSAACIVSGLLAANQLSGTNYDLKTLVQIASKIEGHPDNAAPALLGGMVVGAIDRDTTKYIKISIPKEISFAVMIPDYQLSTEKARNAIPKTVSIQDSVFNTSRAALLVASIMSKNWDNLDIATDDKLHQPYRKHLIPNFDSILKQSKKLGAKGVFLSGAGPTIIALIHDQASFYKKMDAYLKKLSGGWILHKILPDMNGAKIQPWNEKENSKEK